MKILLAVDGSPYSDAAVESTADRPWPQGSEVRIITVLEPIHPYMADPWVLPGGYWEEVEKTAEQEAEKVIEAAARRLADQQGLAVSSDIIKGSPKAVIVDEAERWGAELIVMGSHGYTGLKRMFLGSVSHAVVSHARCSVEIVRDVRRAAAA